MAEGARLESVYTGNRIVGSNPTPSASDTPVPILRVAEGLAERGVFAVVFIRALHLGRSVGGRTHSPTLFSLELCTFIRKYGLAEP